MSKGTDLMNYAVYMKEIVKRFPKVLANDHVNLEIKKGEIHALIGENGAGKSTLMNQLYGLYTPTSGDIFINGEKKVFNGPKDAINAGIGMVHQHFMLVDNLTVAENVVLGSEPKKGISFDLKKARREVQELSKRYGLKVDVDALIEDLPVGTQQRVEIIKTIYRGAEILILDEPTAVLTPQEIEELFEIMRKLRDDGKTIIFISHKLHEVMTICDNITVMRLGKVTGHVKVSETNEKELANMMVGREVILRVDKEEKVPGEKVVEIKNLWVKDNRQLDAVRGMNFEIRKGEVLGIAGVAGNGQTELVEALTGLRKKESGEYLYKGKDISHYTVKELRESNITHIPEDRFKYAMVKEYPNYYNMILGRHYKMPFARRGFLNNDIIQEYSQDLIKKFDVRPADASIKTGNLSGGNQQKVVIAREVSANPDFIVIAQPTRGLDVGAIEYVHKEILELRRKNVAVLLISMELEEVLSLSDRVLVMYEGGVTGEFKPGELTIEEVGLLMAGKKLSELRTIAETEAHAPHHGGDK
ncbi:sugar ABC transporter ATP-binding protein [Tepiditoga spiralis]|uniref:Sugar ABC transporter ATP-binding protein n=2 Tax=Tepiditoga spiralis TaxID=2108365 RepID=A0A7G1G3K3_9BACT|nr:ABC transporter ATP-binding protein [Tepiditoga spiralis]BBE31000.1 sugar ABC transporter ATP-binding protein [Tepiditoga spiralis]